MFSPYDSLIIIIFKVYPLYQLNLCISTLYFLLFIFNLKLYSIINNVRATDSPHQGRQVYMA